MSAGIRPYTADLDAVQARLDALTSDDWSGYADDLGHFAGRCELYAGPWINGYRTGSVFAVSPDCDCGCHPPSPAEWSPWSSRPARARRRSMLAYVTVTRAKQTLDNDGLAWIHDPQYAAPTPTAPPAVQL